VCIHRARSTEGGSDRTLLRLQGAGAHLRCARNAAVLFAVLITVQACSRERPATVTALQLDSLPPAPPLPISHFNVPLVYDYTPILGVVERVVPKKFGSIDSVRMVGDDPNRHYAYEAVRGPFTAFVVDNEVHLRTTLSYAARGYFKPRFGPTLGAGCGGDSSADRPRVTVELVTPLTLTPDWHLASKARIGRIAPASSADRDRCTVSIIRYDVTQRVVDAARDALRSHLPDIDHKISGVDLTDRFQEWWTLLNKPVQLGDSLWLLLGPVQLRMGGVSGSGHDLVVDAGLDARPRIVTGAEPSPSPVPLPPLARDTAASGFQITLGSLIDYGTASRTITEALRDKPFTEAGRTVTVQSARVSPLPGGRLALAVSFTGDASGTLAFSGKPTYERRTGELSVPDLDYDLTTDSNLISAYSWLRSDALRDMFRAKARLPADTVINAGRALLAAGLNRKLGDAVTLSATIDSVDVGGIYVTAPGIVVRAIATGNAGMQVRQHP
jgi:hypothetical protein